METRLYYNWFRYYDPQLGRYVSANPIGIRGGDLNLYAYVSDDPVNWIDPNGMKVYIGRRAIHGYEKRYGFFHHQFIYIENPRLEGGRGTFGLTKDELFGWGHIAVNDDWDVNYQAHDGYLEEVYIPDEDALIDDILDEERKGNNLYLFVGYNCQDWVRATIDWVSTTRIPHFR